MSEQYQPAVEIPLVDPENVDPNVVEYCFNVNDFIVGSSAISLDYFNLLLQQQATADAETAAQVASQIAAQTSAQSASASLLQSGISLTQSLLSTNTTNDGVQSQNITDLQANVTLLQDAVLTISGGLSSYALLLNPIFSDTITTNDLSMSGNIILGDESTISQEQLSFLSTISSNVQTQFADLGTSLTSTNADLVTLQTSMNSQLSDISGAIADIEAEVSTNSGSIASIEADISTLQSSTSANSGNILLMQSDISINTFDISSINAAILLRAEIDNPVFITQITCPQITLNGSIIASSTNISPTELSYLNNASSNIQSQIDSAVTDIALKCPTNNAALTGNPTCPNQTDGDSSTKIANTGFVSTAIANLIGSAPSTMNTLQELAEALQNSPDAISSLTTTVGLKANILNASLTGNSSFANIVVSGTASFPVSSISSAAIDNTHFATLTSSQTISGAKSFTALSTVNKMCENFYSMGTLGSSTASIDFANGSCFYMTPMSSANLTLAVSNVPTSNQSCAYSITSMINTGTYKVYGNSATVNGNAVTLIASGGTASLSVDPSAAIVIQQLNIMFDGSSNPSRVISSVNSFF